MIRRHGAGLRALLMFADAGVAMLVVVAVYAFRYTVTPDASPIAGTSVLAPIVLYAISWVVLLFLVGEYRIRARWTLRSEAMGIARATLWLALLSMSALLLSDLTEISRVFLLLLFPVQGLVTIAMRAVLRASFMHVRQRGRNNRYMLVLGTGSGAESFARQIEQHTAYGLRIVGFVGDPPTAPLTAQPYLGPLSDMLKVLHEQIVDEVAFCLPRTEWHLVEAMIQVCQEEGKIVRIPLESPQVESRLQFVEDLGGTAVLSIVQGPDRVLSLAAKRAFDIMVASLALILLSPVMAGAALYVRWHDGGPVLFRQTRIGIHGRPFTILKFRTMVANAEQRYGEVATSNFTNGAAFKMKADPRITPWGRVLRGLSIDELPQLWNVLRGQMSLVGPRPAPPREVDVYDGWHRRRLSMKPGMTGLWQISSRIDEDFNARARLDLDYIDRWSLWLDLRIVARTVPAVLQANGH